MLAKQRKASEQQSEKPQIKEEDEFQKVLSERAKRLEKVKISNYKITQPNIRISIAST